MISSLTFVVSLALIGSNSGGIVTEGIIRNHELAPGGFGNLDFGHLGDLTLRSYDFDNLKTYFSNLVDYSPINSCNSCAYVSLIQCLSFYDSFYNDNIIPEKYDRNKNDATKLIDAVTVSPGVLRASYPRCNPDAGTRDLKFYNHVLENASFDYQMYLMKIGNEIAGNSPLDYSCRTAMWNYSSLLSKMTSDLGMPEIQFTYMQELSFEKIKSTSVQADFKTYIKKGIDSNNPVVLHLSRFDSTGSRTFYHSVVAYDYDNDHIYANFGYGADMTHESIDSYYVSEAGIFDLSNVEENHSSNYYLNQETYCGCKIMQHTHAYINGYGVYDETQHMTYCSCGDYVLQNHSIETIYNSAAAEIKYCAKCGIKI